MRYERQENVLEYLKSKNPATVKQIANALFVSEATVRRDIEQLENAGYVERFYGGVILAERKGNVMPLARRENKNSAGKEKIAKTASELVSDGDTVFLDSSSTAGKILHYIKNKRVTVITCSAVMPEETGNMRIYSTGGEYSERRKCYLGSFAEEVIQNVYADIFFFSCSGITEQGDITDGSEDEISLRRQMMKHAQKSVFLCDGTKFGVKSAFRLCGKDDVSKIISDTELLFGDGKKTEK